MIDLTDGGSRRAWLRSAFAALGSGTLGALAGPATAGSTPLQVAEDEGRPGEGRP